MYLEEALSAIRQVHLIQTRQVIQTQQGVPICRGVPTQGLGGIL